MLMTVPADLEARASAVVGVPFVPRGSDPDGWDCRGCARWCLATFCGVCVPDYLDLYEASVAAAPAARRDRARLIAEGLAAAWRPVAAMAGAVAHLSWLGSSGHVGFLLTPTRVLHADVRGGTTILDLDRPDAPYRLLAAYVPAAVTEIIHETEARLG